MVKMESGGGGCHAMDGKAFRNQVKQLIDESSAPDLQSFCYWTLYHAFHLWKYEHYVFGNAQKDDTESEMSAAKCLVELKTQSEVTDLDARTLSIQKSKLSDDSNSGNKHTPTPKAISKRKNDEDVCISESVFVRTHGNILFPLDGMVLSSSEQALESASESPLSVVFPWSPRVWTQGMNGAIEAMDDEEIFTNEEEHARNEGFLASTSKGLDRHEVEREHPCPKGNREGCSDISLEVYLGEDVDEVTSESIFMFDAEKIPYLSTTYAKASTNDAMVVDLSLKTVNLEDNCDKIPAQFWESKRDSTAVSARRNDKERKLRKRKNMYKALAAL